MLNLSVSSALGENNNMSFENFHLIHELKVILPKLKNTPNVHSLDLSCFFDLFVWVCFLVSFYFDFVKYISAFCTC